jgi:hypothetical protein
MRISCLVSDNEQEKVVRSNGGELKEADKTASVIIQGAPISDKFNCPKKGEFLEFIRTFFFNF